MYRFIIPLFALAFLLVSCTAATPSPEGTGSLPDTPSSESAMSADSNTSAASSSAMSFAFDGKLMTGKHTVVLHTTKGDITIELNGDIAPKTVTNFITLAKTGYYDGLLFHRVIPDFMIQGGDPTGTGTSGESIFGAEFEDEINADAYGLDKQMLKDLADPSQLTPELEKMSVKEFYVKQGYVYNSKLKSEPMKRGAIAMANRGPNTNGSQFFVVQAQEAPWLNGKHTVFGHVTSGMDVVDAIANVKRDANDKPEVDVTYTVEVKN